jgi:hypothetical protein
MRFMDPWRRAAGALRPKQIAVVLAGEGHAPLWQYFFAMKPLELMCAPKGVGPPAP